MIKQFPDAQGKTREMDAILEARNRGSRNDSSADFVRALHFVNQDNDLSLPVKIGDQHTEQMNFANKTTVYQKGLSPNEIGK